MPHTLGWYLGYNIINCPDIIEGFLSSSMTCHTLYTDGALIIPKTFLSTSKAC